jgi:hypothetical protein
VSSGVQLPQQPWDDETGASIIRIMGGNFRVVNRLLGRWDLSRDNTDMRWTEQMAEAIVQLRAIYLSGDFDRYWLFHIDQDQRRLYPVVRPSFQSSNTQTILVPLSIGFCRQEEVPRIEILVAKKFIDRAMQVVGSGLRGHLDDAGCVSHFHPCWRAPSTSTVADHATFLTFASNESIPYEETRQKPHPRPLN